MNVVAIVAARLGSSRLQGKVLRPIVGVPMLELQMTRLARCRTLNKIVVGTTDNPNDQALVDFARSKGYAWGIGSEEDVLGRYHKIASEYKADVFVRMTGDCPLIDPEVTDGVVRMHIDNKNDETSNVIRRTFPRGMDTEVLSRACLDRINAEAADKIYREHVTNYIYDHPEKFRLGNYETSNDRSDLRLCVDTEEDYKVVAGVFEGIYAKNPEFKLKDVIAYLDAHPELAKLNSHIQQSKIFKVRTQA